MIEEYGRRFTSEDRKRFLDRVISKTEWVSGSEEWGCRLYAGHRISTPPGDRRPEGVDAVRLFPDSEEERFSEPEPQYATAKDLLEACEEESREKQGAGQKFLDTANRARLSHASEWKTAAYKEWEARRNAHHKQQAALKDAHNRQRDADMAAYRAEVRAKYAELIDAWERRFDEYEAIVARLFDLPQLFVAV
jgi:hypothetical protein